MSDHPRSYDYAIMSALETIAMQAHKDGRTGITVADVMEGLQEYTRTVRTVRAWAKEDKP